jgi:hypothetical protein
MFVLLVFSAIVIGALLSALVFEYIDDEDED